MYCVNCGVKLADSEDKCPLCGVRAYHPDIKKIVADKPYPQFAEEERVSKSGILFILTAITVIPIIITLLCNWEIDGVISWSSYVTGAIILVYIIFVLPMWFYKPNPVIFVPVSFAAITCYLLLISLQTSGGWFMSFAFPITGAAGIIATTVVALCRYVRKGYLYINGGAMIACGLYTMFIEMMLNVTFHFRGFLLWSYYPMIAFSIIGLMLIVIAICKPLRESLHKRFFI